MVSRLIAAGLLPLLVAGCSTTPERLAPADTLVNSGIRQQQVHSIMGRDVRVERPVDVALVEAMFARPAHSSPHRGSPAALPGARVFAGTVASLGLAIDAYAKTTGMRAVFDPAVNVETTVALPSKVVSGEELLATIEAQAKVIVHAYPSARMLLVLPESP